MTFSIFLPFFQQNKTPLVNESLKKFLNTKDGKMLYLFIFCLTRFSNFVNIWEKLGISIFFKESDSYRAIALIFHRTTGWCHYSDTIILVIVTYYFVGFWR